MAKLCRVCEAAETYRRRMLCRACINKAQMVTYHSNHEQSLVTSRLLYKKHAEKRRAESAKTKADNRERYSLLEWLRKKGVKAADIPSDRLDALVEMKKAVKAAKALTKRIMSDHTPTELEALKTELAAVEETLRKSREDGDTKHTDALGAKAHQLRKQIQCLSQPETKD